MASQENPSFCLSKCPGSLVNLCCVEEPAVDEPSMIANGTVR